MTPGGRLSDQVADHIGGAARHEYPQCAVGQHHLLTWTQGRLGMSDASYAEAIARAADPVTHPGSISDPANTGIQGSGTILCLTPTRMAGDAL